MSLDSVFTSSRRGQGRDIAPPPESLALPTEYREGLVEGVEGWTRGQWEKEVGGGVCRDSEDRDGRPRNVHDAEEGLHGRGTRDDVSHLNLEELLSLSQNK